MDTEVVRRGSETEADEASETDVGANDSATELESVG